MDKFLFNIADISYLVLYVDIDSIFDTLINKPGSFTKTIPAKITYLGKSSNITESNNYIVISKFDKKFININKDLNIAHLFSPADKFFFPDLVYLAIGMFANNLQEKNSYFIQSSVVKYDDEHSIMLLGDPNAGKTSLAYNLMKNYGFKLISNDNVLVNYDKNRLNTICGTLSVQMRYGGIKSFFPEILDYVTISEEDKLRDEWDVKVYIDDYLKTHGFQFADKSIVTDIYNIVTLKSGNTFIRNREKIDEKLLIYEHLTKQIRNNRYALIGYGFPLPSFENERYLEERYNIASNITNTTNIYDARGTIEEISKRLVRKL